MRRIVVSLALVLALCVLLVSCGGIDYPKEGEYYCEENSLALDFGLIAEGNRQAGRMYTEDGRAFYYYYIDIDGGRISIYDSKNVAYISGSYSFRDELFIIKEDGSEMELVFEKR